MTVHRYTSVGRALELVVDSGSVLPPPIIRLYTTPAHGGPASTPFVYAGPVAGAEMTTISRVDGGEICGEFSFMVAAGMDDWSHVDEDEYYEPTEFVIHRWVAVEETRRTFGVALVDDEEDDG